MQTVIVVVVMDVIGNERAGVWASMDKSSDKEPDCLAFSCTCLRDFEFRPVLLKHSGKNFQCIITLLKA